MPDPFELPVDFNGQELLFAAELQAVGYTHKIKVTIDQVDFFFEPDDEKNYRAIVALADQDKAQKTSRELLQAVSQTLHELFSS